MSEFSEPTSDENINIQSIKDMIEESPLMNVIENIDKHSEELTEGLSAKKQTRKTALNINVASIGLSFYIGEALKVINGETLKDDFESEESMVATLITENLSHIYDLAPASNSGYDSHEDDDEFNEYIRGNIHEAYEEADSIEELNSSLRKIATREITDAIDGVLEMVSRRELQPSTKQIVIRSLGKHALDMVKITTAATTSIIIAHYLLQK
jgi:hypothetical protein